MINEVVSENEWRKQFPIVDQEYIWEYPLFRGESEPSSNLFLNQDRSLTNDLGIYIHVPFCLYRCPMCGNIIEYKQQVEIAKIQKKNNNKLVNIENEMIEKQS